MNTTRREFMNGLTLAGTAGLLGVRPLALTMPALLGSCAPGAPGLTPRNWPQIHSNAANSGFNPVHTSPVFAGLRRWSVQVGPTPMSSPVFAPNGNIYIGNATGTLMGVSRDGQVVLSRYFFGEVIASTVAIDDYGDIYVITSQVGADGKQASCRLLRVAPAGNILRHTPIPITVSSPKILGERIFVSTSREVIVFDRNLNVVARAPIDCYLGPCGGSNVFDCLPCFLCCLFPLPEYPAEAQIRLPSVAVTNARTLTNPSEPLVVACSYPCLAGYVLRGNMLEPLWYFVLDDDICDDANPRYTSPVIDPGGLVLLGYTNGTLAAFDVLNGRRVWSIEISPITGTPTVGLRQIYVAAVGRFYEVDSNGKILRTRDLGAIANSAPALTLDNVFVAARNGIHSFGLNLEDQGTIEVELSPYSDPLVDPYGTLYVVTKDGFLQAYGGERIVSRPAPVPNISWQTPADGSKLPFAAGQTLAVNVSGPDGSKFHGKVSFVSSPDGVLCEVNATKPTVTCVTKGALSLGTHRLTAYAVDAKGAINTAVIMVQVVNTR
jgi:outer membrane protein assembly factor BamB